MSEEEVATQKLIEEQLKLLELEEKDEKMAWMLQEELIKEEMCKQKQIEDEDAELARKLQEKEQQRYEQLRQDKETRTLRRRARKAQLEADLAQITGNEPIVELDSEDQLSEVLDRVDLSASQSDRVLSFEEKDALFARHLQEREERLAKAMRQQEHENRDFELARALQEKEIIKARRRAERRAQAAGEPTGAAAQDSTLSGTTAELQTDPETVCTQIGPTSSKTNSLSTKFQSGNSSSLVKHTDKSNLTSITKGSQDTILQRPLPNPPEATLKTGQVNIMASIDPTYRRPVETAERQRSAPYDETSHSHSSVPDDGCYEHPVNSRATLGNNNVPYMPVSGTRRSGSLEKQPTQSPKKGQKEKESCKQQ